MLRLHGAGHEELQRERVAARELEGPVVVRIVYLPGAQERPAALLVEATEIKLGHQPLDLDVPAVVETLQAPGGDDHADTVVALQHLQKKRKAGQEIVGGLVEVVEHQYRLEAPGAFLHEVADLVEVEIRFR